ncbi:MAG: hypothetical protein DMG07_14590 [Acidobacteria bacterium]|nr:MAG: hypothetical protein DMG07_14590 [Acidobacteriota bacterium]
MRRAALAILALAFAADAEHAAAKSWRAGTAAADITPEQPVWLAGYAARNRPSEGVAQRIYAKALALEDQRGRRLVLVTSDILGFTPALTRPIAERLSQSLKLAREEVLFTSSHTHTAPVVREYMVFAYGMTPEQEAAVESYSRLLVDKVAAVVEEAVRDQRPARLRFGRGRAGFAVNRRVITPRGVSFGVNREGPVDHDVPVLRVDGTDGRLRALVFGYACHNTTLTGQHYQVSGDYAGHAQEALEKDHPGTRALFVAGFAGDSNPEPRGQPEHAAAHGAELAAAVESVIGRRMKPVKGSLEVAFDYVELPFAPAPAREELERRLQEADVGRQRHARRMLEILARDGRLPSIYPDPVHVAQFGRTFTLIAYSIRLRKELAPLPLFLAAYCNDVFAYVPSVRLLREGGYEGGGSMIFYGRPAPWAEEVEERLVDKVHELARRVTRSAP